MALLADKTAQTNTGKIKDALDFTPYAHALKQLILDENLETPLTIGIFGSWGTGKSTLMEMIEEHLKEAELKGESDRMTHPIWFNAWRYSKEGALWRGLLARVVNSIRTMDQPTDPQKRSERNAKLDALIAKLYRTMAPTDLGSLSIDLADILNPERSSGAKMTFSLQEGLKLIDNINQSLTNKQKETGDQGEKPQSNGEGAQTQATNAQMATLTELRQQVQHTSALITGQRIEFIEQFKDEFEKLMQTYVVEYGYLVIFVDDLDRCLPEKAVEILEAMKLFLGVEGCIFILAIDQDVVERGIQIRYGEIEGKSQLNERHKIDGRRYLEKIIQIPFVLPPISPRAMGQFIQAIAPNLPAPCKQIFIQSLSANPRHVKRAINIYTLLELLSDTLPVIKPVRLAKIVVLQQRFEELYVSLRKKPALLIEWEQWLRGPLKNWPDIDVDTPQFAAFEPGSTLSPLDFFKQTLPELGELATENREEFEALKTLLTIRPAMATDVFFSDLAAKDVFSYLYLASTVEESDAQVIQAQAQPIIEKGIDSILAEIADADDEELFNVYSDMAEGQKSFITASLVRQLEDLYAPLEDLNAIEESAGQQLLSAMAQSGIQLYTQLFPDDVKRQEFEMHAQTIKTLQITSLSGEDLIPWELVYDEPGVTSKSDYANITRHAPARIESFWGGRYVIERPFTPKNELFTPSTANPTINYIVDPETPNTKSIEAFMDLLPAANQLTSLEALRDSITQFKAAIHIIQGCCGVDNAGTWISLGSKDLDDSINLPKLRDMIDRHFSIDELKGLCFSLDIDYEDLYGNSKTVKVQALIQYMERRSILNELVEAIRNERPNVPMDFLTREQTRLTRQELNRWELETNSGNGNTLLFLNVDSSIVQHNDWEAWQDTFANLGFRGIIAPTIAPALKHTASFLNSFLIDLVISGLNVGTALLNARQQLWEQEFNPIGLYYAYYGNAALSLKPV